ncbi:hypothetical protein BST85_13045 [Aureitalea marina]|uniref:Uncharacterized protein n=1 Tax=Aureitalea marina TaxID=930804 RepID=A0A2S7KTW2_9FLAO|nr:hypothetical protein BST85_13045 [Aureitalea marina]
MADFIVPGNLKSADIVEVQKEIQRYYNAGGNYHYSYKVVTPEDIFQVSEDFAAQVEEQDNIEYAISPVFKEVNWYRSDPSARKSFHSLRLASGLILPILCMFSIFMLVRYNKKLGKVDFILKALLIGDLILLIT